MTGRDGLLVIYLELGAYYFGITKETFNCTILKGRGSEIMAFRSCPR